MHHATLCPQQISQGSDDRHVVIEAQQDWTTENPGVVDTAPDARNLQVRVVYNIAEPPGDADYRPRYADDRVGIYDDVYLEFGNDVVRQRQLRFLVRWNLQPSDPSKRISPAKHPMVFYLSNTIPQAYRPAIRRGVLTWNAAFEKIGISDALQVRDQPDDPNWDADDIRYNVIRWVTEARDSFAKIVAANPTDDYAQFGLGLAAARVGDLGTAVGHLALAVAMRPDLPHYRTRVGDPDG